jgi:hypothetical protein
MALVKVTADKRHLVDPKGAPFFALGVNYAGYYDRAWKMWEPDQFDPDLIARDFRKAQHSGFNTIRLFVHSALIRQIHQGDFSRLDHTLSMAQDHNLLVLLTLNDSHNLNLAQVAEIDTKIAERYRDVPTVFGYDLENEPVFYNLAAALYPEGHTAPIQTSQLIDHYGSRVSREEAADLQRQRRLPGHLDPELAFYYANALRIFLEYNEAVNHFVRQGKGTLVDFLFSAEAEPWYPLITVLDGTVEAWLRARIDPIRAAGCHQLLTVGWNWLHFAGLPANRLLDFQEYHHYSSLSYQGFETNSAHLQSLRRAFPKHPLIFGEFGWSNQSGTNPSSSRLIDATLTGLYEMATYAYLRTNGFAGGFKWMLNDIQIDHNPYEAGFGVFGLEDRPKPIRDLIHRFSQDCLALDQQGNFSTRRDLETGLSYRLNLPGKTALGGHIYQDETLSWLGEGIAHCFINTQKRELVVDALGSGRLSLAPWEFIPSWNRARETCLYRVYSDQRRTRQHSFGPEQTVVFDVRPGAQYALAMGAETAIYPLPEDAPQVDPKPGEHVLLLADADQYLPAALKYIRRFGPDFTFAANEVAGRWAYVTVVAPPDQISEELLDRFRGQGAQLVERVVGDTLEQTQSMLEEMASRGQRFLSAVAPIPPQEEPPTEPEEEVPPSDGHQQTYIVQPGDTLGKIAKEMYGDFRLWPLIFEANRGQISNPSLIRVGIELQIPEPEQ